MIIGTHALDPRRILTANFENAKYNLYIFKIGYVVGSEVIQITQLGKKKDCEEWLELVNTIIGKGPLIDAISSKEIDDDDNNIDDDDIPTMKKRIGFND